VLSNPTQRHWGTILQRQSPLGFSLKDLLPQVQGHFQAMPGPRSPSVDPFQPLALQEHPLRYTLHALRHTLLDRSPQSRPLGSFDRAPGNPDAPSLGFLMALDPVESRRLLTRLRMA
jgi:hypothetical protein